MSDRRQGMRYTDNGEMFEWADGCLSIPIRTMTAEEIGAWNSALMVCRITKGGPDTIEDRMAAMANGFEARSIRAEQRGMHDAATNYLNCAELLDRARRAIRYIV